MSRFFLAEVATLSQVATIFGVNISFLRKHLIMWGYRVT